MSYRRLFVFCVGWFGYATTYFLRKPLGVIKVDMEAELHLQKSQLGLLDMALLLPYACTQIFLSSLADKFTPSKTYAVSLMVASASVIGFGRLESYPVLLLMLAFSGAAQALCWPCCCRVVNSWYVGSLRNTAFGILGTSALAGGVLATSFTVYIQNCCGWKDVYLYSGLIVIIAAVPVYLFFHESPDSSHSESQQKDSSKEASDQVARPGVLTIWRLPAVVEISVTMFTMKLVRYCFAMWLPMYLLGHLHYSKIMAGLCSTSFEIGGVLGSVVLGYAIDKWLPRKILVGTGGMVLGSTLCLVLFIVTSTWGKVFNLLLLGLAGAFNCTVDAMLSGSISTEIGNSKGMNAGAAVTGFINGFGTIGAVLEGPLVGWVSQAYGWSGMLYMMVLFSMLGTLSTFRAAVVYARTYGADQ